MLAHMRLAKRIVVLERSRFSRAHPKVVIGGLAITIIGACAKELPPPGILPDEVPPRVEKIFPAPDSISPGFNGQVLIRFDEPVNIPNGIERLMFVSPMERYLSDKGFSELRLRPLGGWRNNVVYCFSIPAGISDLSRNRTENPTEFCFSTGAPLVDTRVVGTITDAITGQPQTGARVIFFAPGDTTPYGAIADGEGHFTARTLPPGDYQAFGFLDENRNLILDRDIDPHDSVALLVDRDSVPRLEFSLVPPDTTPPRLLRAQAMDTTTVRLEFDDYLINPLSQDPDVFISNSKTGVVMDLVAVLAGDAHEVVFPGDSVRLDSIGGLTESDSRSTTKLPSRFISIRLATALDSGRYLVEANGVVNLRHLTGGGDTTFVVEGIGTVNDSIKGIDVLRVLQGERYEVTRGTVPTKMRESLMGSEHYGEALHRPRSLAQRRQ